MSKKFFYLLRYAIGTRRDMPDINEDEWPAIYKTAQRQCLVGVLFGGLEQQHVENLGMSQDMLFDWFSFAEQIRLRNQQINERCIEVCREYEEAGFDTCVLKGQGNAMMYDRPGLRSPGDIDIWVVPRIRNNKDEGYKARVRKILDYVRTHKGENSLRYYHVEYDENGVSVEAHFTPGILNNPFYNYRLQHWYKERQPEQMHNIIRLADGVGQMKVPTLEFNIVYQLAHMMHHFFDEGIGLRHMVDYYFLLKRACPASSPQKYGSIEKKCWDKELKILGLRKFAGAVMWALHEILDVEERLMIVPADEWRGRTLVREMLRGGNLGKGLGLNRHTAGSKYFLKHWRNLHFVRQYPTEALCEPLFRTWHFFWRLWMKKVVLKS